MSYLIPEVELDKNRLWCPNRNCETICSIEPIDKPSSSKSSAQPSTSNATQLFPRSVLCPTCSFEFCSSCKKPVRFYIFCKIFSNQDVCLFHSVAFVNHM